MSQSHIIEIYNLHLTRRSDAVSIYKVPDFLVQRKGSAYVPQMVGLGPVHHKVHPEMLDQKRDAAQKIFKMNAEELEQNVYSHILSLVPMVRNCYQSHIIYEDSELADMLTSDGCTIVGILRALGSTDSHQSVFDRNTIEYTAYLTISDIVMLENQIPLFVLLKILELELKIDENYSNPKEDIRVRTAYESKRAGIEFREVEQSFLAIRIEKSKFYLPVIRISTTTETLIRNHMAYEMCEANETCPISSYVLLMCELIDSERDVHVLKKAGIIKSYMRDREVADLFRSLSKDITRSYKDPFAKVREDAHKQYRNKFKGMLAEFAEDYCSSPCRSVPVVVTGMLFLFAAVQAIFSLHRRLLS